MKIWLALVGLAFLVSCTGQQSALLVSLEGRTMGTTYHIKYVNEDSFPNSGQIQSLVDEELVRINQLMSTYIADSEISRLNKQPASKPFGLSKDNVLLMMESLDIHRASEGAFDVTVGPLVNLWGFGPDGRVTRRPSQQVIDEAQKLTGDGSFEFDGEHIIKHHDRTYFDFSAIAKGYGVDKVADVLESQGIYNYLVEIGGELRIKGTKADASPWKVAVERPEVLARQAQLIFSPGNVGMATSGDYRNYFEDQGIRYSHTIDPSTAMPITHKLASVTVLAERCATADAWATALNVLGPERGMAIAEKHNIAAYMLVKSETGFDALLTTQFKAQFNQFEE